MKNPFRATGILRAVREKLGRLNRVLREAGSSEEDLVFHIRRSELGSFRRDQATQTTDCPRSQPAASRR
jgi:hypothetical protein